MDTFLFWLMIIYIVGGYVSFVVYTNRAGMHGFRPAGGVRFVLLNIEWYFFHLAKSFVWPIVLVLWFITGCSPSEWRVLDVVDGTPKIRKNPMGDYLRRAMELGRAGRHEESIQVCDEAIRLDPDVAAPHFIRGTELLFGFHKYKEAIAAFDKAISIDSTYADPYLTKACALLRLGNNLEAIDICNQGLRLHPHKADAAMGYYTRAQAFSNLGRYQEARTSLDQLLQIEPNYADAQNLLQFLTMIGQQQ